MFEDITKSRTPLEATGWTEFWSLFRMKISLLFSKMSSKMCEPKAKFNMQSRRQLWRHDCNYYEVIFSNHWHRISPERKDIQRLLFYCCNLLDKGYHLASYFNNCKKKKYFSKISRKDIRRWMCLDEQNSDHFSDWKYLFLFLRYRRKCANARLNWICRAGVNYDVMIAIMT